MPLITSRRPFSLQNPYRPVRPNTSKIIFLSFEGSVTEEEYFERVSEIFSDVRSKIQFISVAEDAVHTHHKYRSPDQARLLSKNRPKQLVDRIDRFKADNESRYEFSKYPEDEFWIVTDVDNNWSPDWIGEWNIALEDCERKGYCYAISNPFFEIWLLLHHAAPTEEDKVYAVTDEHEYQRTNHFNERLEEVGAPLRKKHIFPEDYDEMKVVQAIERAKVLHRHREERCPKYFATTVYILLEKIIDMLPKASGGS